MDSSTCFQLDRATGTFWFDIPSGAEVPLQHYDNRDLMSMCTVSHVNYPYFTDEHVALEKLSSLP